MKNFYYTLLTFLFFNALNAQIVNIPDANFKARLLAADVNNSIAAIGWTGNSITSWAKIDTNNDGEIQQSEASLITYLELSFTSIANLTGLEYFTGLHWLKCDSNQIATLNLLNLPNLEYLNCEDNLISSLNFSNSLLLKGLVCRQNNISILDFTGLYFLEYVGCSNNNLSILDFSNNPNFYSLGCGDNNLTSVNIKNGRQSMFSPGFMYNDFWENNPDLQYVCADGNEITELSNLFNNYLPGNSIIVNSNCGTSSGTYFTINGNSKYDVNLNGCDALDNSIPNLKLNFSNGTYIVNLISDISGNYSFPVSAGTHTITPVLQNPIYFNVSPITATVTFPTATSPFTQNFCVTANGTHPDLEVSILPITRARPGFDASYKIVYKNKGTNTQSGSVNLNFDDAVLDFVSATPTVGTQTVNNLNWAFTNLLPFESRSILVTLNLNSPMETPPLSSGSVLAYNATITSSATDDTPLDNAFAFNQNVVNSFDPNDKTCLQGTTVGTAKIGDFVHYMIRFQNDGTAAAQNIVVKDMIDMAKFDIASLIPIDGSASFTTKISETNKVEFIFQNINLPFATGSNQGFVSFKIKTKSTLVLGDAFSNTANIYFDYNFPIVTNTYTTTIAALATQDFEFKNYFSLYPNPAKDILNIEVKNDSSTGSLQGIAISSISIYNMLGQVVLVQTNDLKTIDISNLKTGNYFVKITTDKGSANSRFVKE